MYYLVKFICTYNKVVLEGFIIGSQNDIDNIYNKINDMCFPIQFWIGGETYRTFEDKRSLLKCLFITKIREKEYKLLLRLFGRRYGNFPGELL